MEGTRPALEELADDPASRRRFLRMVGGAGGAGALSILISACGGDDSDSSVSAASPQTATPPEGSSTSAADNRGDLDVVNFALTLEYVEADFYRQVAESGIISDAKTLALVKRFGDAEQQHVEALMSAAKQLGGTPVAAPATSFEAVLQGGPRKILQTAATVENLGAAAYLGQAAKIRSKEILAAALSIHSVEARHAAALNELTGAGFRGGRALTGSLPDGAFAKPMSKDAVLAAAKPFLAA